MVAQYQIPLQPSKPQSVNVTINGTVYGLKLYWNSATNGGWTMDISDANGDPLVCGIPLVTGADLLAQYPDKEFGFKLYIATQGEPWMPPTWKSLGTTSLLIAEY